MPTFSRSIALLLVFAQALAALGLGPRSVCRDSEGVACVGSALAACCCHWEPEVACCDEGGREALSPGEAASLRVAPECRCVCAPMVSQVKFVQRTDARAKLSQFNALDAVVANDAFAPIRWASAAPVRCVPRGHGPLGHTALLRLDSVILSV